MSGLNCFFGSNFDEIAVSDCRCFKERVDLHYRNDFMLILRCFGRRGFVMLGFTELWGIFRHFRMRS